MNSAVRLDQRRRRAVGSFFNTKIDVALERARHPFGGGIARECGQVELLHLPCVRAAPGSARARDSS